MQIYAQANYNNKEKQLSRGMKFSTSQRENNLAEKHFNSKGTILKIAEEIDTLARDRLTLTFVFMHNKKLMSGKFIQNHVYSYSLQRHCLYLPEDKTVSPRSDGTSGRPDIHIGEVKPPSAR